MLDLDKKRAALTEAQNKPHPVRFGGELFHLPPRVPLESLDLMTQGAYRKAFALIFDEDPDADPAGGEITARFFKNRPDREDLEQIMSLYGPPGESSASPTSSDNGGRPSKRTSKLSTDSTSRSNAMAAVAQELDGSLP
jgi:hypothetical protein